MPGSTPSAFLPTECDDADTVIRVTPVELTGQLICRDQDEAALVREHLPRHIHLTRAEAGCTRFDVTPTEDSLVWTVREMFVDDDAFAAHQRRVADSVWGHATAGIERRYRITRS